MKQKYQVKTIVTSSGERFPMLLGRDGLPLFDPTVFSLSEVRSRNRASNTIDSYLRSILVFLLFIDLRNINLEERLKVGQLLSLGEIEELVGICRLPVEKIHTMWDEVSHWIDSHGEIANADLCKIAKVDTLSASRMLKAWVEQSVLVPIPERGKRNMAYSKPTQPEELGLLSEANDNNLDT